MNLLPVLALSLAAIPAALTLLNLFFYRRLPRLRSPAPLARVSVLIPARNEERCLRAAIESVLASIDVDFELLILDDHSTDRTAQIIDEFIGNDPRVKKVRCSPLPPGWCGKPHACFSLARSSQHPWMVFLDADVRLEPEGLARMTKFMISRSLDLASGVPKQVLTNFSDRLLVPLIHFVLLGYLPMPLMRWSRSPSFAAGCGQLFIISRAAYWKTGGHDGVCRSLHDGITLPRHFRRHGMKTDLFDATEIARCAMFPSNREVWKGLARNATEGLAHPARILPFSLLLLGGAVLPFALLLTEAAVAPLQITLLTVALAWLPRIVGALRYSHPWTSVLLHPIGILGLVGIQWWALGREWLGKPAEWKGRVYSNAPLRR